MLECLNESQVPLQSAALSASTLVTLRFPTLAPTLFEKVSVYMLAHKYP